MKNRVTAYWPLWTVLLIGAAAVCCAAWGAPSSSTVQRAVLESLRRDGVPAGMSGNTFWGEKEVEADVTLVKIGNRQGTGGEASWPVRVRVRGRYTATFDGSTGRFSGEAEYMVRRNAFGEWVATHSTSR